MLLEILDGLEDYIEILREINSPVGSAFLIGFLFFGFVFTIYILRDIIFNTSVFSLLYPDAKESEILLIRLCWIIIIVFTYDIIFIGTFGYYFWKLRQLRTARERNKQVFGA